MANSNVTDGTSTPTSSKKTPTKSHIDTKPVDAVQMGLADGAHWIEENAKIFVALIVVAVVGGLGYVGFQAVAKSQEKKAQEAYYAVAEKFTKAKEAFDNGKFQAMMPNQPAAPDSKVATGDLEKDYGTLVGDLEKVARDNAGTTAGAQAAILAGNTYLEYKQPEKAVELAQLTVGKLGDGHTLKNLANMLLGNALATKGDCQEAVNVWQKVIDNSKASYLHGDASLRAGLCLEQLGQTDRAMEMYRKASATESAAATSARGLLRALEIKAKPATETKG